MEFKNLYSRDEFVNEAKQNNSTLAQFKKDIKNILEDMFAFAKKPKYVFGDDGFPTSVEFEIDTNDYKIDYSKEDLKNEFTEGVLKKRTNIPVLKFDSKDEDKEKEIYKIKFKISKENVSKEEKEEKDRPLTKDSDEQLLSKLKSKKTSDNDKEKIMDILKDRGVDYKNPFDEDEDSKSDEEMDKEAEKGAKKK